MPRTTRITRTASRPIPLIADLFSGKAKLPTPKRLPNTLHAQLGIKTPESANGGGPGNNNSGRVHFTGPGGLPLPTSHPYRKGGRYR